MTTPTPDPNELILEALKKAAAGQAFTLSGPTKLFVHDGQEQGKQVAINGGTDLLFKGVRAGKRSPFIFEFEPFEPMGGDQTVIDLELKKVEQILPRFAGFLYGVLARAADFEDEDTSGWLLPSYLDYARTRIVEKAAQEEAEREAEKLVVQSERYSDSEVWGQW